MRSIGSGSEVEGSGDGFPGVVWRDGWGRSVDRIESGCHAFGSPVKILRSIAHGLVPSVSVGSAIQSYFVIWQDLEFRMGSRRSNRAIFHCMRRVCSINTCRYYT